ncbi:MAG: HAMP domain-containing histidine kinase [Myxococcales bacterium]|nr:HAMP domain-containing histidine kinase [Myxococcales bacterium]
MLTLSRLEDVVVEPLTEAQRWTGRALTRFAAGIAPWGAAFALLFTALGQPWVAASLAVASIGVGVVPLVLRTTGSLAFASHWLCAFLSQSLLVSAGRLGGVTAASVPWLAACVVVATLVAGWRAGAVWAGLSTAMVVGLFVAQVVDVLPVPDVPPNALALAATSAQTGLFMVALVLVTAAVSINARARRELELARAAAEDANRAKSDFLARMSHELRTPLNGILGYAELLAEDAAPDTARDLGRIRDAGGHLLSMINDVLDLARVEAGRLPFEPREVQVGELLQSVVISAAPLVAANRNRLRLETEGEVRAWADDLRLRQCVLNLVSNAAKFTTEGEIALAARHVRGEVLIEVRDTGVGMTSAQLERVFEPFAQATDDTDRQFGGSGLGLAIVRQYADRMGGSVEAVSEPGRGSVFTLRMPVA